MGSTLLIYGAGGLGVEVVDIIRRSTLANSELFFVDDFNAGKTIYEIHVLSFEDAILQHGSAKMVIAQGEPAARKSLLDKAKKNGFELATVIDSSAIVSPTAKVGDGSIICPHCILASSVLVGENVLVNAKTILGHDVKVGDNSVMSSMVNIGGRTCIDEETFIGMGTLVKDKLNIGARAIVSMASAVFRDIPSDVVVVGNPARVAKKNDSNKIFK